MKVLFLGGTGNISTACVRLALDRGYDVTLFNCGQRPLPFAGRVRSIRGDRYDSVALAELAHEHYDVVADFIGFTPDEVALDVNAFGGQVGQYVYISSASAYQKPLNHYVITESTPLCNPYWEYSRNKIACEDLLTSAYRQATLPVTIVRPSYTYGETWVPCAVGGQGYTVVNRMRSNLPVISHGDGTSLWVMTHNSDFAVGFVGLFGNPAALGEAFHITSDQVLTWDQIYRTIGTAAGCSPELCHVSSDLIARAYPELGPGLWGDKAHSVVFDNSKIKRVVPEFCARVTFAEGMARSIAWYDADPARQVVDKGTNDMMNRLVELYGARGAHRDKA